jgi:hypothetical protein
MARRKVVFLTTVLLVLGAGVTVGRLSAHLSETPLQTQSPHRRTDWVAAELNLSTQQHQQMDAIWADVSKNRTKIFDQRRALTDERDQGITKMLTEAQRIGYDKVLKDYRAKLDDLNKESDKAIADANLRSQELLDKDQKKIWDNITAERIQGRGRMRQATQGSTTRPYAGDRGGMEMNFGHPKAE